MTPMAAVGSNSCQLVCSVMPMATTATATMMPTAHQGYAGGNVLVTSIGSIPVMSPTTKPTAMPATRAPKVSMVDRNRPAAVTGNPLIASWTEETSRPVGSSSRIPPTTTISGAIGSPRAAEPPEEQGDERDQERTGGRDEEVRRAPPGQLPGQQADQEVGEEGYGGGTRAPAQDTDEDCGEHRERHGDHPARERLGTLGDLVEPAHGFLAAHAPDHNVRHQLVHLGQAGVVVGPGPHHPQQGDGGLVLRGVVDGHRLVGDVHLDVLQAQGRGDGNDAGFHLQGPCTVPEHGSRPGAGQSPGFCGPRCPRPPPGSWGWRRGSRRACPRCSGRRGRVLAWTRRRSIRLALTFWPTWEADSGSVLGRPSV